MANTFNLTAGEAGRILGQLPKELPTDEPGNVTIKYSDPAWQRLEAIGYEVTALKETLTRAGVIQERNDYKTAPPVDTTYELNLQRLREFADGKINIEEERAKAEQRKQDWRNRASATPPLGIAR